MLLHTFCGTFLDALPHELQEELLSWEAALFHMSPSSASHWLLDKFSSSPPPPHPSCIGLGAGKHTTTEDVNQDKYCDACIMQYHYEVVCHLKGKNVKHMMSTVLLNASMCINDHSDITEDIFFFTSTHCETLTQKQQISPYLFFLKKRFNLMQLLQI